MINTEITIDTNYNCHLKCSFCSTGDSLSPLEMPNAVAEDCLRFFRFLKSNINQNIVLVITGGEPLLFNALPHHIKLWGETAESIILCTTGTVQKDYEYWADLYSKGLKCVRLGMSWTGTDGLDNNELPLKRVSDLTVSNLTKIGIEIEANFLLNRQSISKMNDVFKYGSEGNFSKVRILGLSNQGQATKNWDKISLTTKEINLAIDRAKQLSLLHNIRVEFAGLPEASSCSHSDSDGKCLGGKSFFHIITDGTIYPCPSVKSVDTYSIGTVLINDYNNLDISKGFAKCLVLRDE